MIRFRALLTRLGLILVALTGCDGENNFLRSNNARSRLAAPTAAATRDGAPLARGTSRVAIEKVASKSLPNMVQVGDWVISGGQPDGEAAFAELRDLGIKTVISVDGARPDIEGARRFGLQYVHLPQGYAGIPDDRSRQLAKAVRDLPGPIYLHCHHGKHRSPAATAVACIGAGLITIDEGREILRLAGTGENYRGLFLAVDHAVPLDAAVIDSLSAEFAETTSVPATAELMISIEHRYDRLQRLAKNDWKRTSETADGNPSHEALLLHEVFTELLRDEEMASRPDVFQKLARESEDLCRELEEAVRDLPDTAPVATTKLDAIGYHCKQCHQLFRDASDKNADSSP